MNYAQEVADIFQTIGATNNLNNGDLLVTSPLNGETIAHVQMTRADDVADIVKGSHEAFQQWRSVTAPRRGELLRLLGDELRTHKEALGRLVSIEAGKIPSEGLGEVQEMIDICDFAVGLSRQLYGLTIVSERPGHRMMENWHPLGVVGIISAFNFPVAVWSWNSALALVTGNAIIWKPSEKTPLTGMACQAILNRALTKFGDAPKGLAQLIIGGADVGDAIVENHDVALVSATGSTRMGRIVGPKIAARFGKSILELGGNNAMIITPSADLDMATNAAAFGAMGTAGQRCTSTRRLFVHDEIYDQIVPRIKSAYKSISVGNPLDGDHLVGPLIDKDAYDNMQKSIAKAREQGANILGGERQDTGDENAYYVRPALAEIDHHDGIVLQETFAPILYIMRYTDLHDAIAMQNSVSAGLSSAIFTLNLREAETFLSAIGSDCGIANVNIGTSGAEIGGAFGGEKETGGGRESGSDAWKGYMRRATNTINYSSDLPLAQGVSFDIV